MGETLAVMAVLLGLVLLLAIPVNVVFRFEGIEAFNGRIAIHWLFGLVRFGVRIPGAGKPPAEPDAVPDAAKARSKPEERSGRDNVLALLQQAPFRRRVYSLVKGVIGAIHLRQFHLRMRLGLGDPADTGRLWAFMGPLNALAQNLRNADVQIEPEFMYPAFEFHAHGRVLLIPLQFLVLAVSFALSPASIGAWRTLKGSHA